MFPPLDRHDVLAWWAPPEGRVPFVVDSLGVTQLIGYVPFRNADGTVNEVFSNYEEQRRRNEMASYHRWAFIEKSRKQAGRMLPSP